MTTHTMRLPVRAWQVGPLGQLEKGAIALIQARGGCWRDVLPGWVWNSYGFKIARPGDWIVESAYGLEAMTDAEFRERCDPT